MLKTLFQSERARYEQTGRSVTEAYGRGPVLGHWVTFLRPILKDKGFLTYKTQVNVGFTPKRLLSELK